jgi:hypothetical protein
MPYQSPNKSRHDRIRYNQGTKTCENGTFSKSLENCTAVYFATHCTLSTSASFLKTQVVSLLVDPFRLPDSKRDALPTVKTGIQLTVMYSYEFLVSRSWYLVKLSTFQSTSSRLSLDRPIGPPIIDDDPRWQSERIFTGDKNPFVWITKPASHYGTNIKSSRRCSILHVRV